MKIKELLTESVMFNQVLTHETSPLAARQIKQQGFKPNSAGIFFNVSGTNYSGGGYGGVHIKAQIIGDKDDILDLSDDNDLPDDLEELADNADGDEIARYCREEGYWAWTDGMQFVVLDPRHIKVL
jgi:hypothetical protein